MLNRLKLKSGDKGFVVKEFQEMERHISEHCIEKNENFKENRDDPGGMPKTQMGMKKLRKS
jgi:hypothetical protein